MSPTKKPPRSVERIGHLFLSTEEPSKDDDAGPSRMTRPSGHLPSGQLKFSFGFKENADGGKGGGSPSDLRGGRPSLPPLTLLDFLLDDEAPDETE